MTYEEAVSSDPEILGGALCFSGTRVPVRNLFDYLEGGNSIDYFLEAFDWVAREKAIAVLDKSAETLESQRNLLAS